MKTLDYTQHRNDLHTKFKCECPDKAFIGTPVERLMTTTIHLYGYDDNYFFNVVNKEPREIKCDCGKRYSYQWKPHGVEVQSIQGGDTQ